MVAKVAPSGRERLFQIDEMFFSSTDEKGVILFGNSVFIKISGYEKHEMFRKPHNIIRHPSMPKAVFKLFWDTVKSNQPIVAYVQNMAKNGDYYWVLAAAFPIKGGYISIRVKPTSALFSKVKEVYSHVLEVERKEGMEAAGAVLLSILQENGFSDYREFMINALFIELRARDKAINRINNSQSAIEKVASTVGRNFQFIFDTVEGFRETQDIFRKTVIQLLDEFHDLKIISINLAVLSANVGDAGVAMGKISSQFQELASEIRSHLKNFSDIISSATADLKDCLLNAAFMKIQMDMVDFFVHEMGNEKNPPQSEENENNDLAGNLEIFFSLCQESNKRAQSMLDKLEANLTQIRTATKDVKKYVNGLDVIEKMGAVEAGRTTKVGNARSHLEALEKFNHMLRLAIQEIGIAEKDMNEKAFHLSKKFADVEGGLEELFLLFRESK